MVKPTATEFSYAVARLDCKNKVHEFMQAGGRNRTKGKMGCMCCVPGT